MSIAKVNGADIYYEAKGDGAPLLLLPGLARGTSYYDAIEPSLRKIGMTIVVDPRGIGRSSGSAERLTAELWADDFVALIKYLGLPSAHVVGSSNGGSMAMAMALRHPSVVGSLILFGAFSEIDRYIELNMKLRIRLAKTLGMGEDMRDFIALFTFGHEFLDSPMADQFLDATLASVKLHTPERYTAMCETILHWGRRLPGQEHEPLVTSQLGKISCPTLVACGGRDFWIPAKFSRIIAAGIPHAVYMDLPNCGHIPVREDPAGCVRLIKDFIDGIGARATNA